jgi:cellulose synthase/poly-beta-1,6-N-acetylglucosamine synthase-like glycosyltransferase
MKKAEITVVVPAFNEADNIKPLIKRIHQTCAFHDIRYEVIIIDDHSQDSTIDIAASLTKSYPVKIISKQGKPGKAFSLIEGFGKARFNLVAMIDADLQYPPENIPHMISIIMSGKADVVVANRALRDEQGIRTFISRGFQTIFSSWLHQINVDSQSGLKVFKKSILKKVTLNPKPWTFDLDFLTKARDAGYVISGYDIAFKERVAGDSKVELVKTSLEIGWEAVKLKFKAPQTYPLNPQSTDSGFFFRGTKYRHFNHLPFDETALMSLSTSQQKTFLTFFLVVFAGLTINWQLALILFIGLATYFYFADVFFNLFIVSKSIHQDQEITFTDSQVSSLKNQELPRYTIFCPLYKEAHVLPQFVSAIQKMDYPKDKLQVMLLLEQDDKTTIRHAEAMNLPSYFEIVVVPDTLPKTKPKACNYGLLEATGEFSVIYDAEDVPDPLQLKKAVLAFKQSDNTVACVQAKLNFYNPEQNLLTRLFTAEYSLWFNLILPGLQSLGVPIPLGGTSNHFRTPHLRLLYGWDAFNVTEDCDLGLRLFSKGYKTLIIDSVTYEEANSQWMNWLNQRTRWLKGYMQTYLVHMRQAVQLFKAKKFTLLAGIQMVVGGKILALLINPFMWILSIAYFSFRSTLGPFIESLFPASIFYFAVAAFVMGNFLYMYYFMLAATKTKRYSLVKYTFFMPLYWLMISIAAWKALVNLVFKPHYWFKTQHGLHLNQTQPVFDAVAALNTPKSVLAKE